MHIKSKNLPKSRPKITRQIYERRSPKNEEILGRAKSTTCDPLHTKRIVPSTNVIIKQLSDKYSINFRFQKCIFALSLARLTWACSNVCGNKWVGGVGYWHCAQLCYPPQTLISPSSSHPPPIPPPRHSIFIYCRGARFWNAPFPEPKSNRFGWNQIEIKSVRLEPIEIKSVRFSTCIPKDKVWTSFRSNNFLHLWPFSYCRQ